MKKQLLFGLTIAAILLVSCGGNGNEKKAQATVSSSAKDSILQLKVDEFIDFKLTTDISRLSIKEKKVLTKLFEVSRLMDEIFWLQAFGEKSSIIDTVKGMPLKNLSKLITVLGIG